MRNGPDSLDLQTATGELQRNVESANVDWVQISLPASPTRLSELLRDGAGLADRWGMDFNRCLENIEAVVFLKQGGRPELQLRTKSDDAIFATIPAGEDYYIPAVRIFDKFISGSGTAVLALHTELPLKFD